ncbi:4Fe-4S binding protein [Planctomycetota bacterium]
MKWCRFGFQIGFLLLIAVSAFAIGGNCEAWCPFGGVELLCTYIPEQSLTCSLASSNLYTLIALLGLTLVAGRAFCSWICPIGALSEWLGLLGNRTLSLRREVPRWLDTILSALKYPVAALILYFTYVVGELVFRGFDPCYALISRHGHEITAWAYVALGAVLLGSLFVALPFCRWLCPMAAVMNPVSFFGILKPVRDPELCLDCGKCDTVCPMAIPASKVEKIHHARCTACLECTRACPERSDRRRGLVKASMILWRSALSSSKVTNALPTPGAA